MILNFFFLKEATSNLQQNVLIFISNENATFRLSHPGFEIKSLMHSIMGLKQIIVYPINFNEQTMFQY